MIQSFREWLKESESNSLNEEQFKNKYEELQLEKLLPSSEIIKIKNVLKEQGLNIEECSLHEIKDHSSEIAVEYRTNDFKTFLKTSWYEPYILFICDKKWDIAYNNKSYAKMLTKNIGKKAEECFHFSTQIFLIRER